MAIHHLTPPVRGGERPRLPSSQVGPVTRAIRTMRAAEPGKTETFSVSSFKRAASKQRAKSATVSHLAEANAAIAAIHEGVRRFLAERIERDIALLDALDGDCDVEEDDPAGGDVCDEPHDPEEDGDDHERSAYVTGFDGTNYMRGRS